MTEAHAIFLVKPPYTLCKYSVSIAVT